MDAFLCCPSLGCLDDHDNSVRLQYLNEEDKSTHYQVTLFAENLLQPIPHFTPSSPSLDMEAAIQHLSRNSNAALDVGPKPLDEPDVLMNDSFLEYVLNEPQDAASPLQASDARASYLAIVRSLYEIVGVDYPFDCDLHKHVSSSHVSSAAAVCCDGYVSSGDAAADETDSASLLNGSTGNELHETTIKYCRQVCNVGNLKEAQGVQDQTQGSANHEGEEESTEASARSEAIRFAELNLGADYISLYVPEKLPGRSERSSRAVHKSRQGAQSNTCAAGEFLDVRGLLESCAVAVGMGDFRKAHGILHELYHVHGVSLQGNSLQRVAHYFCDALVARMAGMGGYQYRYMRQNLPPVVPIAKIWYRLIPFVKITHYFANQSILKAAEGSSRLHILDFGIMHGMQWPCLINALADRKGGPPLLVITGIGNTPPCQEFLHDMKQTGQRLAAYARLHKVPFQFHSVVSENWQDIDAASLQIQDGELLVVNTMFRLRNLPDESTDLKSPVSSRQKFFTIMRSLSPHHLVASDISAACNSPFFVSRFREAFRLYEGLVDILDTVAGVGDADWLLTEQRCYARDILNMVACEGADRVERPESYKQWDAHISRAGFELLAIPSAALCRSKSYVVNECHRNFMVQREGHGWMLLGWKGRPMVAMSAWRPLPYRQ